MLLCLFLVCEKVSGELVGLVQFTFLILLFDLFFKLSEFPLDSLVYISGFLWRLASQGNLISIGQYSSINNVGIDARRVLFTYRFSRLKLKHIFYTLTLVGPSGVLLLKLANYWGRL